MSMMPRGNMDMDTTLPNAWVARPFQKDFFDYMLNNGLENKRGVAVWHRRAGKDSFCLNLGAIGSQVRVGTIYHMLPTLKQGRRVIWDGIDKFGRRMIDQAFPKWMRESTNNSEMQIKFKNGSIWQVVGSDNYDSLVGTNPVGLIMSEYSIADPTAWDYMRPILAENNGWALFIYTPRGKNHGHMLYEMSKTNPKWYSSLLTVDQTVDGEGERIITDEAVQEERDSGMSKEKIQQEFYCSWDAGLEGAFYTDELKEAETSGRIGEFPWNPLKPVQTWWDIGFRDSTSVIFTQRGDDGHPIIIDYMEGRNKSLAEWIRDLRATRYDYESHNGPHDLDHHDWSTGKTRKEMASDLGFHFDIVPKIAVEDGIDQTRAMIMTARFNKPMVEQLLASLYSYRREFDEKRNLFKDRPVHDWSSHGADSARYLSVGWQPDGTQGWDEKKKALYKHKHKVKRAARR